MQIHYLQHEPFEDPGTILEWAAAYGHSMTGTMVYKSEPVPRPEALDLLVVMGGSMSVYEENRWPWLAAEEAFIGEAIGAGKPVLGICLGAQLMASALGAEVRPNLHKEIGWFPVTLSAPAAGLPLFKGWPGSFEAFHWHGDTFEIPSGAVRAASSGACANQAFVYGRRAVGLQFHLESTGESVARLVSNCGHEIVAGKPYIQSIEQIRNPGRPFPSMRRMLFGLLDAMLLM